MHPDAKHRTSNKLLVCQAINLHPQQTKEKPSLLFAVHHVLRINKLLGTQRVHKQQMRNNWYKGTSNLLLEPLPLAFLFVLLGTHGTHANLLRKRDPSLLFAVHHVLRINK